jgi:hypothetical protein
MSSDTVGEQFSTNQPVGVEESIVDVPLVLKKLAMITY